MSEPLVTVYSGTTLENFIKCGSVNPDGNVSYYKSREKRHDFERVYYSQNFDIAAARSVFNAKKAGHLPLIMEATMPLDVAIQTESDEPFRAEYVWFPNCNWLDIDFKNATVEDLCNYFDVYEASFFL